jgi:N-acetylmuramoyl-L-alanine amidase
MLRLPRRIRRVLPAAALLLAAPACFAQSIDSSRIEAIRFWSFGDVTRIAIETKGDFKIHTEQIEGPPRLFFDLSGLRPPAGHKKGVQSIQVQDALVKQIRVAETMPGVTRIVFDLQTTVDFSSSQLGNPDRLMIEIRPKDRHSGEPSVARSSSGSQRFEEGAGAPETANIPAPEAAAPTKPLPIQPAPTVSKRRVFSISDLPVPSKPMAGSTTLPDLANRFPPPGLPYFVEPQSVALKFVLYGRLNIMRPPPYHRSAPTTGHSVEQVAQKPADIAMAVPGPESARIRTVGASAPAESKVGSSAKMVAPATIDSNGNRSLVRVFGLKMGKVVIDPGHGGHDTGTIGPHGLNEKDLVLDVSLRLGKLIQDKLGSEVIYTRSDDTFIPLEQRPQMANEEKADLFISVHANSSPVFSATGVETYYFNFTSDKSALDLATRENATSTSSIHDLNDLLQKVVLKAKVEESREFAQKVQNSLYSMSAKMNARSRDRGVRKAPFVVLIGATMPSILAEIGFVSNPHDESLLKKPEQRQKIAEALYKGIEQYSNTLSHDQIARVKSSE